MRKVNSLLRVDLAWPASSALAYGADRTSRQKLATAFQGVVLLLLTLWIHPVWACRPPDVSYLEVAQDSDAVLVGTLGKIGEGQAQFAVEQVLKGNGVAPVVEVTPVSNRPQMCAPVFQEGETLVLFLKNAPVLTILVHGAAVLTFTPETKNATIEGVKHLLKLPPRTNTEALAQAMLGLATSDNRLLQGEALSYISRHLNDSKNPKKYQKELIELLKQPDHHVRRAALYGLQFRRSVEALPLVIEIARGDDLRLADTASMVLAKYDTLEAVEALIALTRHAAPALRIRALIDLGDSNYMIGKAALIALLDDPDPQVRALAPRGLVMLLRSGKGAEVIPKLIEMLNDPVAEVQVGAAGSLGETDAILAIAPLFEVLRRKQLSPELEKATIEALYRIYARLEEPARLPFTENLAVLIAVMERGRWVSSSHAMQLLHQIGTPEAIAALRQAAQNHPQQGVREEAKRLLTAT